MIIFADKTDSCSTFIRFKDNGREYKVEVFDDMVCIHIYNEESLSKIGSYWQDIKSGGVKDEVAP